MDSNVSRGLAVVGSGVIACGLAATAAEHEPVLLIARSDRSAKLAEAAVEKARARLGTGFVDPEGVEYSTNLEDVASASFVVEAIVEDFDVKAEMLATLNEHLKTNEDAILASTTSSLSVEGLANASNRPDRFLGLHVFNPVTKMQLVELVFPSKASDTTRERARDLCVHLEKIPVVVRDKPGFVVNRLLFPYLFSAVSLLEETGLKPEDIDECMRLGAGHPMGPLALLDLVGLDVSMAIGEHLGVDIPEMVENLVADGHLGRKTKRGILKH
jgi:3-hydroxybutyryl-CoA dehydrogenase